MTEPVDASNRSPRSADSEHITAFAPGKVILFGEHAVVYRRPAIAVPVFQVRAQATVERAGSGTVMIHAPDVGRQFELERAPADDPIASIVRLTAGHLQVEPRGFHLHIHSTIPVARGLGSGAAVSVAIARALAGFFFKRLSKQELAALAFEVEKLHHGTPSGIDNTVVAYEQPVYFVRDEPIQSFRVAQPFLIAIADTGVPALTKIAVGDVRRAWEADRVRFESLFDQIGTISHSARQAIESGQVRLIGSLMNENQALLGEIGVSSPEVENLVQAAMNAGALGAKLSGGGRGGNIIALVRSETREQVAEKLRNAGASNVMITRIA